MKETGGVYTKQ